DRPANGRRRKSGRAQNVDAAGSRGRTSARDQSGRRRGGRARRAARRADAVDARRVRLREAPRRAAVRRRRLRRGTVSVNNRWVQLCAALVAMIMIANLQYAWTLFVNPMQQATGWKLSDIQWAFTLFILFQTWVQPCQGWLIDRVGPRVFITVAGVLCGIGWGGLGLVHSLPVLYVLYTLAGIGAALVYGGSIGGALKWFK